MFAWLPEQRRHFSFLDIFLNFFFSPAMTQALKDELKLKAEIGTFQLVLSYASVTAFKKD